MKDYRQMLYNQIVDLATDYIDNALYSVQDDILRHFDMWGCDTYEIDIDTDTRRLIAVAIADSLIECL